MLQWLCAFLRQLLLPQEESPTGWPEWEDYDNSVQQPMTPPSLLRQASVRFFPASAIFFLSSSSTLRCAQAGSHGATGTAPATHAEKVVNWTNFQARVTANEVLMASNATDAFLLGSTAAPHQVVEGARGSAPVPVTASGTPVGCFFPAQA